MQGLGLPAYMSMPSALALHNQLLVTRLVIRGSVVFSLFYLRSFSLPKLTRCTRKIRFGRRCFSASPSKRTGCLRVGDWPRPLPRQWGAGYPTADWQWTNIGNRRNVMLFTRYLHDKEFIAEVIVPSECESDRSPKIPRLNGLACCPKNRRPPIARPETCANSESQRIRVQ